MTNILKRVITVAGSVLLASTLFVSPALAATAAREPSGGAEQISLQTLRSNMPQSDRAKFDKLSSRQQHELLAAALDPSSMQNAGIGKWKAVEQSISKETVASPGATVISGVAQAAAVKRKTDTHKINWKLFGITYASVEARMTYQYNGKIVTAINSCGGFYTNLVPLRTIQSIPTQYFESKKTKAVCEIRWHMTKSGGIQVGDAVQGLRVNGKGSRIAYWDYDA